MSHKIVLNTSNLSREKAIRQAFINQYAHLPKQVKDKETRLLTLLNAKSEKYASNNSTANQFESLYTMPANEREIHIAIPKEILIDKMIAFLEKL